MRFQANVYLFAVYCNRVGLTYEAILRSVQNVQGTVPHFLKASERDDRDRERKREEGVRGMHINPVQGEKREREREKERKIITSLPVTREMQRWRDPSPVRPSQSQLILNPGELFRLKCTEVSISNAYVNPKSFPFKSSFSFKVEFRQRGLLH